MFCNFELSKFEPFVVNKVDFGESNDAVLDAEEFKDAEVLLRLRLPPLCCGHHEHACGDAADSGEHVAQEFHVSRNVDEAQFSSGGQHRVGEAEVDGQPTPLLFF